ncbi:hypothetical protein [Desulfosporosinus sp. BICA1-9]|uniref:hypothetical protein n=1 Tax=Desulfosporosinus sp. BICA1-9 TaxID=1531958 RepID=UPI00054C24DA|nr:hypothetical protein [Desulfosporosinus sp. BICA1-9]KJS47964.1 MAG: hypothetical protein VR66_16730 [Peptococcaceae bacterium BRH_c23]KJS88791.1 MAG: hypothetical protein JL57_10695 [Desulfosporosinus sp. BICA1-9]HBW34038.1 hypothetical protein [Desulfosporosinus sp.]
MALLNYNRSILTNFANSSAIVLTGIDQIILEFGLFVAQPINFVELLTTIGWDVTGVSPVPPDQPIIELTIHQDGIPVASINQESIQDGSDSPLENLTTFQAVLTNVAAGHHVYRLLARNLQTAQGTITITGPANISGKVIG